MLYVTATYVGKNASRSRQAAKKKATRANSKASGTGLYGTKCSKGEDKVCVESGGRGRPSASKKHRLEFNDAGRP